MAIIQKVNVYIGNLEILKVIKCNAKGEFSIDYPDVVNEATGKKSAKGPNKDTVEKEWYQECHKVLDAETSKCKVIIYEFKAQCKISKKLEGDQYTNGYEWIDIIDKSDFYSQQGLVLGISAEVFIETKKVFPDGNIAYIYDIADFDDRFSGNISNSQLGQNHYSHTMGEKYYIENQVPWSQENYDFFQSLNDNLENLILRLDELTKAPGKILEAVNNGGSLMITQKAPGL